MLNIMALALCVYIYSNWHYKLLHLLFVNCSRLLPTYLLHYNKTLLIHLQAYIHMALL